MDFFVKKKDSSWCEKNLFFDKGEKASLQHEPFVGFPDPSVADQHLFRLALLMRVGSGSRACTKHLVKVNQSSPGKNRTPAATVLLSAAPENLIGSLVPASQKWGSAVTAVPVSHWLGGGAEHAHRPCIRNQSLGRTECLINAPEGSGIESTPAGGAHRSGQKERVTEL